MWVRFCDKQNLPYFVIMVSLSTIDHYRQELFDLCKYVGYMALTSISI